MNDGGYLPRIVAHRCGGALAPENTLAGLRVAAALGCRGVEFDVQASADGEAVVIHDDHLDRTTDRAGRVAALTAAELASCDAGVRHHPAFAGEAVPRLAEIADSCRRLGLVANVELKCEDAGGDALARLVVPKVVACWRGAAALPLLSSFSEAALAAAAEGAALVPRALLVEQVPADWRERLARLGCIALHCRVDALEEGLVRDVHRAGYRLAAYTENDPERAARWLALGVDALFTDRPELLLEVDRAVADASP
ncbi:MAG: glycerophosphodiester phosphodiesterase [Rhodocyclaceae bacterium]|nr:glycerophosphodiester phosphodiesterase [Rhodocyclaceae bacterium]